MGAGPGPLVTAFVAARQRDLAADGEGLAGELEAALQACVDAGTAAWPEVAADPIGFIGHLARHIPGDVDPIDALSSLHADELYLAWACVAGDLRAMAAFDQRYIARVPAYVSSLRLPASQVDETRDALRVKLLSGSRDEPPRIAQYSGRGSLDSWVCVAALRTALSLQRQMHPAHAGISDLVVPGGDPELQIIKDRYRADFEAALREAMAGLPVRDRTLLRLRYVERLTHAQLARLHDAHRQTVARWLETAHQTLLDGIRLRLRERLQLSPHECDSLLRLLTSRIDLTIETLLAVPEAP